MNPNDDYILIDTPELKKLMEPAQRGDEYLDPFLREPTWQTVCRPSWAGTAFEQATTYRRLRSKAWLKVSEHPIQYPAWVWGEGWLRAYYFDVDCGPFADSILWQPAPPPPRPPEPPEEGWEPIYRKFMEEYKAWGHPLILSDRLEKLAKTAYEAGRKA